MRLIEVEEGAGAEPATVADIRRYCRIEGTEEDVLLETLIRAGRRVIETETGLALASRRFRLRLDRVPADGWVRVPRRPLAAVTAVSAFAADGSATVFAPEEGIAARGAGGETVRLSMAARFAGRAGGVEIEFRAGLAPDEVPAELLLALYQTVALAYEWRGASEAAGGAPAVPAAARRLLAPFRRIRP